MTEQGLTGANNLFQCVRTPHKSVYPEGFVSARVELSCRKICEKVVERYEAANPGSGCGPEQVLSVLVDNCLLERAEAKEVVEAWQTDSGGTVTYRAEKRSRLQQVIYDELAACNAHLDLRPDFEVQLAAPPPEASATDAPDSDEEPEEPNAINPSLTSETDEEQPTRTPQSRRIAVGIGAALILMVIGLGYMAVPPWQQAASSNTQVQILAESQILDGKPPFAEVNAIVKADLPVLISFWMKPGQPETSKAQAVLGWGGFSTNYDDHVLLALPADGSIRLNREQPRRADEPGYVASLGSAPAVAEADRWQHIAVAFDPALTVPVRLYIDAQPQVLVAPPGNANEKSWSREFPDSDVFFVGGREDFVELGNFVGEIGPVTLVQSNKITDEDVRRAMERSLPGSFPGAGAGN